MDEARLYLGATIMLVEDDIELAEMIQSRLEQEGFKVVHEENGLLAATRIQTLQPHLVILDLMLPGLDGFGVCREVRPHYHGPILMLTARGDDPDQIEGLQSGADDYVAKPVHPKVLIARIEALLRRYDQHGPVPSRRIEHGPLAMDATQREVTMGGHKIDLTTAEFDLLWYLSERPGQVLSRDQIYRELYDTKYDGYDRAVDVYVSRIRAKIGGKDEERVVLKTVRGVGYLLAVKESAS
ncbi:Response regulator transcription factor [Sulfidibacter corallicola]|uniref:Response regulator transcription factor n=1 Tax=Sulfidibacter corallicola TaxID=2818388 RepID=A0A8A4TQY1_SULCO|nr:response regulator transcription factor [Sulfidibacter corallicola]QTD52386.1 response regulator transcription factor [Sulfidibacter corallicola]